MKHATFNGQIITAGEGAPDPAYCLYCGQMVELILPHPRDPFTGEPQYFHRDSAAALVCPANLPTGLAGGSGEKLEKISPAQMSLGLGEKYVNQWNSTDD